MREENEEGSFRRFREFEASIVQAKSVISSKGFFLGSISCWAPYGLPTHFSYIREKFR